MEDLYKYNFFIKKTDRERGTQRMIHDQNKHNVNTCILSVQSTITLQFLTEIICYFTKKYTYCK